MNICVTEIESRWPRSQNERLDMMLELEKRGLVRGETKLCHGRMEKVWRPL